MIILKRNYLFILLLILFLLITLFSADYLSIENIKENKLWIKGFISNNYMYSVLLFFLSCVIFINSPIPFAAIIKILGGFFFGFYLGTIYNIIATILACLAGFGISRYTFKEIFERIYYERLKKVENEVEKNGFYYFLTLRLIMVVPYFLINIVAGISRISFKKYMFSTILGVMPASVIYANGGNQLEQIDSISDLFQFDTIISLILIASISLVPLVKKKFFPN